MSFLTKTSVFFAAASLSTMILAGGSVPMVQNNHNGFGVTMGVAADNTNVNIGPAFKLGITYAQSLFKGYLLVGAFAFNPSPITQIVGKTQWFVPLTLGLGMRYGLTDNLYGTLSAVGTVHFMTKKPTNFGNA